LRRYEPRSRFPQKPPFRAHFRAFYPHPATNHRCERNGLPNSWHPGNVGGPHRLPGHCSPVSRSTPHAPRQSKRAQVMRRPSPAGYCLPPTAQLPKTERTRSRRAVPLFQYVTEPDDFADKIICSSPLAAAHPLTVLSWPEAFDARSARFG
jgi:hypothetical protein